MSAAADRPVRLRLGTRVAALGALLVVAVWLAAAIGWIREARAVLDRLPRERSAATSAELERVLADRLAQPPISLDQALIAARAREAELLALRETRRGRRLVDEPSREELVREQLELALVELGAVDAAWLRVGARFTWAPRGRPRLDGAGPLDGPCLVHAPGGRLSPGRCLERPIDRPASPASAAGSAEAGGGGGRVGAPAREGGEREGPAEAIAGAARFVDLSGLAPVQPGIAWALAADDAGGEIVAAAGWQELTGSGGLPAEEGSRGLPAEEAALAELAGPLGLGWALERRSLPGPGLRVLVAAAPPERLEPASLLRGRAGSLTPAWRAWSLRTGGVAAAALLFFLLLGLRVNAAFRPVLEAARGLGADDLEVRVPVRRADEIGALAAVLNDLGTSLKHARRNWEREARLAAWRDVARGLAHEIKNPLTPIRGTVENLLRWKREDPARLDERLEARLGTILEEVEQLSRLASAFSDFARLPPPRRAPTDLDALLRDVAALQLGDREGLRVEDRLDASLADVAIDAGQLRQVATNLMKNAREALGAEGGLVRLESGPQGRGAWFSIADDGPGVDEASLERLFVPGWSTRKAEGGSGLGLWLCHRIVLEHGGTIEASRSELGGLRVRVSLPEA